MAAAAPTPSAIARPRANTQRERAQSRWGSPAWALVSAAQGAPTTIAASIAVLTPPIRFVPAENDPQIRLIQNPQSLVVRRSGVRYNIGTIFAPQYKSGTICQVFAKFTYI